MSKDSMDESLFAKDVITNVKTKTLIHKLFTNQMRIVAAMNDKSPVFIQVPFSPPKRQWSLVGIECKHKSHKSQSWYDGYQLYANMPLVKDFRRSYTKGIKYEDVLKTSDDNTFTEPLVYKRTEGTEGRNTSTSDDSSPSIDS